MRGWLLLLVLGGCAAAPSVDFDRDGIPDADDCAPEDPDRYPGSHDLLGDGVDQNCDGVDGSDGDGDGFTGAEDCDEADPDAWLGAEEIPGDGIDQDCDGVDLQVGLAASCGTEVLLEERFDFGSVEAGWIPRDTAARVEGTSLTCDDTRCLWDREVDPPVSAPCWQMSLTVEASAIALCDVEWSLRSEGGGVAGLIRLVQHLGDQSQSSVALAGALSELYFDVLPQIGPRTLVIVQDGADWHLTVDGALLGSGVGAAHVDVAGQTLVVEGSQPGTCRALRGSLVAWR